MNALRVLRHINESRLARRASRFRRPDLRLSLAASVVISMSKALDEAIDDVRLFGGDGDCLRVAGRGVLKERDARLRALGFSDVEEVYRAVVARTTPYVAYKLGVL